MVVKEVNPHFEDFIFDWDYKTYFLVGGYGSSKSYHVALKIILKCLEEKRKVLVVREVFETIRDSCFALFEEIISDLELDDRIKTVTSPMQVKFPNGSQIIFKGMDKPAKLKSIHGVTIVWIEECSELKYEGYKELLGRARHPSLSIHFILSTNPVGEDNWVYTHFFMDELKDIFILDDEELYEKRTIIKNNTYYHHSLADDNLFLPQSYIEQLDELKLYDPDLYRIARRGRFGVNGIKVLPQFETMEHEKVLANIGNISKRYFRAGMDFGFVVSYNALLKMAIDDDNKWLYIYKEYYKNGMTDDKTAKELEDFIDKDELIRADSAEPKTIAYYNQQGFRMIGAKKGPGSRLQNTKKVKRFKRIICSDKCKNTIRELKNLTYATDKQGNIIEDEFNIDAHTFEAIWYGLDGYEVSDLKDRKNYSGKGRR
ncbi:PBSX family phage terminase large subunit [Wansuia hejianensis]|uniref:PBSX family phage terminase large subunit n=1 Tax=Wansuia hejianensis TaxID=2763667 RepID=A0A926F2A1_9FIRM|nr:PBSX family phage terminase large subunit [Wansuia hejianensis]